MDKMDKIKIEDDIRCGKGSVFIKKLRYISIVGQECGAVKWSPEGKILIVLNDKQFNNLLYELYGPDKDYKKPIICTFLRQLSHYGFSRSKMKTTFTNFVKFSMISHPHFVRDNMELQQRIIRKQRSPNKFVEIARLKTKIETLKAQIASIQTNINNIQQPYQLN